MYLGLVRLLPEADELQYRSDGYVSKTYDPLSKRQMVQRNTPITVNRLVWMGLPEHELITRL